MRLTPPYLTLMLPDQDPSTVNAFGLHHFSPTLLCLQPTSWHFASFIKHLPPDTPPSSRFYFLPLSWVTFHPTLVVPSVLWTPTCIMTFFPPVLTELSYFIVHFPKPLAVSISLSHWVRITVQHYFSCQFFQIPMPCALSPPPSQCPVFFPSAYFWAQVCNSSRSHTRAGYSHKFCMGSYSLGNPVRSTGSFIPLLSSTTSDFFFQYVISPKWEIT